MQIIGNITLSLAAFFYLLPLQLIITDVSRKRNDGGAFWGAIFALGPLWILLTITLLFAIALGGFDWLPMKRGAQYPLVLASGVALLVVTLFSFLGKVESHHVLPWAARPFLVWAVYIFPLVVMAFALLTINPSLGSKIPSLVYRVPVAVISAASLLACLGMLMQWGIHSQQQQSARIERAVEQGNERNRTQLARVESINATDNFVELLGFTNRFENEAIRKIAIEKVQALPNLTAQLAEVLQGDWAEKGLVYLDGCDVTPPERKVLAEPVRAAMEKLAEGARDSIERTHTFYAEQFDTKTRLMLSVSAKFSDTGVNYAPAIRAFRTALDAPRGKEFRFNARPTLDAWLAQH